MAAVKNTFSIWRQVWGKLIGNLQSSTIVEKAPRMYGASAELCGNNSRKFKSPPHVWGKPYGLIVNLTMAPLGVLIMRLLPCNLTNNPLIVFMSILFNTWGALENALMEWQAKIFLERLHLIGQLIDFDNQAGLIGLRLRQCSCKIRDCNKSAIRCGSIYHLQGVFYLRGIEPLAVKVPDLFQYGKIINGVQALETLPGIQKGFKIACPPPNGRGRDLQSIRSLFWSNHSLAPSQSNAYAQLTANMRFVSDITPGTAYSYNSKN